MNKRIITTVLSGLMAVSLVGCSGTAATSSASTKTELTGVDAIIQEAEGMSLEELAKKAIEESNGKTFYGLGNSSRGKTALPLFISYLQTIDPNYNMKQMIQIQQLQVIVQSMRQNWKRLNRITSQRVNL